MLAAQGTPGGTVIVLSNATFVETVTVTQSVVLEAGPGFSPALQGSGACGGIGRNCTLDLRPNVPGPQIAVRGLRILPGLNPTDLVKRGVGVLDVPALGGPELAPLALLLATAALLSLRSSARR